MGNIALSKTLNSINKFKKIIREKGTIKAGKWLTLSILNEDIDDIIKIVKSSEYSEVQIDGVTEAIKNEIKR